MAALLEPLPATPACIAGVAARLQALVDWERGPRGAMRVDLAPQRDLLARLGEPQRRFRSVHVAGTKGKGSVCALIEAGLANAGWRTGRYASPHVDHVTERICHAGRPVAARDFERWAAQALDARDAACRDGTPGARASWFDVITAAAFTSFAEARLDWAVVEVGMGGLLDSTNVIEPELALVTNIGFEHVEVLGPTLADIAGQKAGIVKPGRPVLTPLGDDSESGRVIAQRAAALGAPLIVCAELQRLGLQARNLGLARHALDALGRLGHRAPATRRPLDGRMLTDALAQQTRLPGRLERLAFAGSAGEPLPLVLDGAHVGFALAGVLQECAALTERHGPPVVVLALGPDKDVPAIVAALSQRVHHVVCTRLGEGRPCRPARELAQRLGDRGVGAVACDDPFDALDRALDAARAASRWLLVTGSLHLVGTLRPRLAGRATP